MAPGSLCAPSINPRRTHLCVRCGRRVPTGADRLARHPELEREWTIKAGESRGVDACGLNAFAESRTMPGPVLLPDSRSLVQEAREEVADGRNYVVWELERLLPAVDAGDAAAGEQFGRLFGVLACLTEAWAGLIAPARPPSA